MVSASQVRSAYLRTPEGAAEVAERLIRERAEAEQEAVEAKAAKERERTEKLFADAEEDRRQLEEIVKRQEACFSWTHQLRDLTNAVKESLHNPDAFEHVKTMLIVPDENRNNVAMEFRAENGFGAIRTFVVKAQLVADGCVVQNIGEPVSE